MSLLQLRKVSVEHRIGTSRVASVRNVDLTLESGATYGLLGFSGCGKTTLARAIVGLQPISSGQIRFDGQVLFESGRNPSPRDCRRKISMVFQDPSGSLNPRITVGKILNEAISTTTPKNRADSRSRIESMLARVGLAASDIDRYPHEFSGGQRQRIAIARALIAEPRLVICDEPVSALDLSVQAQIVSLLMDLQAERGLTYLFITHNIDLARVLCNHLAIMSEGAIVEHGPTSSILNQPSHPATLELLQANLPCLIS